MAKLTSRVFTFALRRGVRTGSRSWFYIAAGAQGLRLLQRVIAPKPEIYRIKLRPGEGIEIRERPRDR
jgi:hypothetical protein